jgi:hypothetical protein
MKFDTNIHRQHRNSHEPTFEMAVGFLSPCGRLAGSYRQLKRWFHKAYRLPPIQLVVGFVFGFFSFFFLVFWFWVFGFFFFVFGFLVFVFSQYYKCEIIGN